MKEIKYCVVCNKELQGLQQKFCSQNCKTKDFNLKTKGTKQNSQFRQHIKGTVRKLYFVNMLGGCCSMCGYDKNLAALDFHHIDSNTKSIKLDKRSLSNNNIELLTKEAEKCILLCANCHRELHNNGMDIETISKDVEVGKQIIKYSSIRNVDTYLTKRSKKENICPKCGSIISCNKAKLCSKCSHESHRKVERPSKEVLIEDIKTLSMIKVGKKYGVSDNAIRKWCKGYEIKIVK